MSDALQAIRDGAEFTVRVGGQTPHFLNLQLNESKRETLPIQIVGHKPPPPSGLKVGDLVTWGSGEVHFRIEEFHGSRALLSPASPPPPLRWMVEDARILRPVADRASEPGPMPAAHPPAEQPAPPRGSWAWAGRALSSLWSFE